MLDKVQIVMYMVSDAAGNVAVTSRRVFVRDTMPPTLRLDPSGATDATGAVLWEAGVEWQEPGVSATDNAVNTRELTSRVVVTGTVDVYGKVDGDNGNQTLIYSVADNAGLVAVAGLRIRHVLALCSRFRPGSIDIPVFAK